MRWWLLLLLVLAGCQPRLLPPRPVYDARRTLEYPSGLKVLVEAEPGSRRLAIALRVGAGGAEDPPGREGLAHFLEHLSFRARPGGSGPSHAEQADLAGLASRGARPNASTRPESTTWLGIAPAEFSRTTLPLMASFVAHPLDGIDDRTLEVERNIVINELYDDDPHTGGAVGDAISASVLPQGFPGSRPVGGSVQSVGVITRGELEDFARAHYVPSNISLVLVGDLELDAADALVRASLPLEWLDAPTPVASRNRPAPELPAPPPQQDVRVEARVRHRQLLISWAVPGVRRPLGSVMPDAARLLERSIHRPLGVRRLKTTLSVRQHTSVLTLLAELDDGASLPRVRELLRDEPLFDIAWRTAAGAAAEAGRLAAEQSLLDRAERLSLEGDAAPGPPLSLEAREQLLRGFVAKGLAWEAGREVQVLPLAHEAPGPAEISTGPLLEQGPPLPAAEAFAAVALGPPLGETRAFTLENGLQVLISRRPTVPVASVALGLPARALHAPRAVGQFLEAVLDWKQADADREFIGRPDVDVGADATVISLSGDSRAAPLMLEVLGRNLPPRVVRFEASQMRSFTGAALARISRGGAGALQEQLRARERALEVMPPGSSATPPSFYGARAMVENTTPRDFEVFVERAWHPEGAWLVIDGDVDLGPTEAQVRALFAAWRPRGEPLPAPQPLGSPPVRAKKLRLVASLGAVATIARLSCRVPAAVADELPLLEDALQSALGDELRQSLGLTYGVRVGSTRWKHEDNLLVISAVLNAANEQQAVRRFLEKLEELGASPWPEERLGLSRWHVAKEHLGRGLDSLSVAAGLARAGAAGTPLAELSTRTLRSARTPLPSIQHAWEVCRSNAVVEIEGELGSLEKALGAERPGQL